MKNLFENIGAGLKAASEWLLNNWGIALGTGVTVLALVGCPTPASAQPQGDGSGRSINFLSDGITSLTVSNGIGYTNLSSPSATVTTNWAGLSWTNFPGSVSTTNNQGTNIVADLSGTNANGMVVGATTKLTKDIELWSEQVGTTPTNCNFSCTSLAGAGNITTNAIVFVPLWDGTNESTYAPDLYQWNIAANGQTPVTLATNAPLYKWPGARKLRVKFIASGTNAANSAWTILALKLNGFPR